MTCFLGRCKSWATVSVNGLDTVDVRVSGRGLRDGQWRTVQVCR